MLSQQSDVASRECYDKTTALGETCEKHFANLNERLISSFFETHIIVKIRNK